MNLRISGGYSGEDGSVSCQGWVSVMKSMKDDCDGDAEETLCLPSSVAKS